MQTIKQMNIMVTTNQIKQFAKGNQYIQDYLNFDSSDLNNFMCRKFGSGKQVNHRGYKYDIGTFRANNYHYQAFKELKNKFGNEFDNYHENFTVEFEEYLFTFWVSIKIDGKATIDINGCTDTDNTGRYNKLPFFMEYNHIFKYEGAICENHFKEAVKNEIEKQLFAPGFFRDIQLKHGATKERAKLLYKSWLKFKHDSKNDNFDSDSWESIQKHCLKRLKLDLSNYDYPTNKVLKFIRRCKGFDTVKTLCDAPDIFDVMNNFDGDVEDVEILWNETMSEYPNNTILL